VESGGGGGGDVEGSCGTRWERHKQKKKIPKNSAIGFVSGANSARVCVCVCVCVSVRARACTC
jgi:hypothetical protein